MSQNQFVDPSEIRDQFSAAMSRMYMKEVPAYGDLVRIVGDVNQIVLGSDEAKALGLEADEDVSRISQERHGAIRLGTATELSMMRRAFAIMGMVPVSYYDLSVASIPVHSTAFRPVTRGALAKNPFRVFTSLLRLELIEDDTLRSKAEEVLASRQIFTNRAIALVEQSEGQGGLERSEADEFVAEVLETFRWRADALVDFETYMELHDSHRLIADVVSFKGPHINHLTPRTLNIDKCQQAMVEEGLPAKAVIEGPPPRACPILLRQTSFKALEESVNFKADVGNEVAGKHTARFGEIEQRGVALTPKGRGLYDKLLAETRAKVTPAADGSNAAAYEKVLAETFSAFPDNWRSIHDKGLGYFRYGVGETDANFDGSKPLAQLLDEGVLTLTPIIYEDFLPVSAAGIFQSNLGDKTAKAYSSEANQQVFEEALGAKVADEFVLYEEIQTASLEACLDRLKREGSAA